MINDLNHISCNVCGSATLPYDGVNISNGEDSQFLCSKCYNEYSSKITGVNFDHLSFHPVVLQDKDEENHTFHFQTHLISEKVNIRALEIKNNEPKGYEFLIYGDAEDDLFGLFSRLVDHIRCELGRKHIEVGDLTRYEITKEGIVRGHILWDDDTDGELPCLVIDGKELSWHEFGRMLTSYEGQNFKLKIFEGIEEE
jgi:hypothetical protein